MQNYFTKDSYSFRLSFKIFSIGLFFLSSLVLIFTSFSILYTQTLDAKINNVNDDVAESIFEKPISGVYVFASLPSDYHNPSMDIKTADARPLIIDNYLDKYDSPLTGYGSVIVETADNFGVDFRLITAIAQQESNLCKKIPVESYNCWGWGIHSRGSLGFDSFESGIATVTKGIKVNYIDKGFLTVDDIMQKYTPLSQGSWAQGVSQFMRDMQ